MSFLGIDVGTTGCKAIVFDERGRQLGSAYREYDMRAPKPRQAELDSEDVVLLRPRRAPGILSRLSRLLPWERRLFQWERGAKFSALPY